MQMCNQSIRIFIRSTVLDVIFKMIYNILNFSFNENILHLFNCVKKGNTEPPDAKVFLRQSLRAGLVAFLNKENTVAHYNETFIRT